jgi:hypothetical protein
VNTKNGVEKSSSTPFSIDHFVRHFSILIHGGRLWPNAVLLNQFSQALSQIYRQTILGYFHHGKRLSCI